MKKGGWLFFIGKNVKKISIVANVFPHLYNKTIYKYENVSAKGVMSEM